MANVDLKKDKDSLKNIITIIVILILVSLNISVFISHHTPKTKKKTIINEYPNVVETVPDDNATAQAMQNNISQMGERDRCQTYIGEFFTWIDNKEYDKAYNVLNSNFKANNFATIEDFQKYCEEKFPQSAVLSYTNIERESPYYILTLTVDDDSNSNFKSYSQRFVVKENGNNNFEISFQLDV